MLVLDIVMCYAIIIIAIDLVIIYRIIREEL